MALFSRKKDRRDAISYEYSLCCDIVGGGGATTMGEGGVSRSLVLGRDPTVIVAHFAARSIRELKILV